MHKVLIVAACLTVTGCAHRPWVGIDAIASPDATNYKTYVLADADKGASPLEFEQYAEQINKVLTQHGFVNVAGTAKPDFVASLATSVGALSTTTSSGVTPTYGVTGSTTQSTGIISGGSYYGTSTSTPTYGITGSRHYQVTEDFYPIGFSIVAWRTDQRNSPIWQVTVTRKSPTPDLRRSFPFMLKAASPYIGKDTGGLIRIRAEIAD